MSANRYKNAEGYADPTAGEAISAAMRDYRQKQRKTFAAKHRMRVSVASPYRGENVRENLRAARRYCRIVIDAGHMPIAPHLIYPQILNDEIEEERELGLAFGISLLKLCDELWVFGEPSEGMRGEIAEAQRMRRQIVYFDAEGNRKP